MPCMKRISIFGSIFKVENRSEDPNLRIAEESWCPGGGGARKKKYQGGSSSILPAEKMEDVLRAEKVEDGEGFFVPRKKKSPSTPSSVRSSTHYSGPKTEDGGLFDLRFRKSKIEDEGFFDLRFRRSNMEGLRYSAPMNEEGRRGSSETLPSSKNPSFFEEPPPPFFLRSSVPKIEEHPPILDFQSRKNRRSPCAP